MICTFKSGFSAAHFYHRPEWSEQKNRETFGKCFTEYGHGHDYVLEISFDCEATQSDEIHKLIKQVTNQVDHQHLNFVFPEFKTKIPTTENLAEFLLTKISEALKNKKAEARFMKLRLFESPQVWVEFNS